MSGDRIGPVVRRLLGLSVTGEAVPTGRGFGNQSWVVPTSAGRVLVKVARSELGGLAKVRSASVARQLAVDAGVAVPRELAVDERCPEFAGRLVRVYEYWDGRHPDDVLGDRAASIRFFAGLGHQLARLHAVPVDAFSSRLNGGAPRFPSWADYVDYRLPQIRERAVAAGAFEVGELDRLLGEAGETAHAVSTVVTPSLAHRDVYLDNVLALEDERACALLDFDIAEAWDAAVDFVKLRWQVFCAVPGSEAACVSAYVDAGGELSRFAERVRVVEILELVNTVVGAAASGSHEFEQSARQRLAEVANP